MWDKLNDYERAAVVLMLLSAFVDIMQFSWMVRKGWVEIKKKLYDKIKKELLLEQLQRRTEDASTRRIRPKIEKEGEEESGDN